MTPLVRPLKDVVVGQSWTHALDRHGRPRLVMLIVCANVANLLLVRADGRRQELAVRAALGASWMRIAGELLVESLLLGVAGGVAGLAIAYGALRVVLSLSGANFRASRKLASIASRSSSRAACRFWRASVSGCCPSCGTRIRGSPRRWRAAAAP